MQRERDEARSKLETRETEIDGFLKANRTLVKQRDELQAKLLASEAAGAASRVLFDRISARLEPQLHEVEDREYMIGTRNLALEGRSTTCGTAFLAERERLLEVYRTGEKAYSDGWPTQDDWIAFRKAVLSVREALKETK